MVIESQTTLATVMMNLMLMVAASEEDQGVLLKWIGGGYHKAQGKRSLRGLCDCLGAPCPCPGLETSWARSVRVL